MERFNLAVCTRKIYNSGCKILTLKTLKDILEIKKSSTLFSVIDRLLESDVLFKVEKGKYLLKAGKIHDFTFANFLYQPSYISFETALNFYGILSQFPYEVTSATPKKTKQKTIKGKLFSYSHLQKSLFWGYEKKDEFLMATPEKALLDQLYLAAKGLRGLAMDEYDLSLVNRKRLKNFLEKFPQSRQFKKIMKVLPDSFQL